MVKYYQTLSGTVYGGDRLSPSHKEVVAPPAAFHVWDGAKWVEDLDAKNAVDLEQMIKDEMRTLAIDSLKAKGKI